MIQQEKDPSAPPAGERRGAPRLALPLLAFVHGQDATRRPFLAETRLANVSASGLYCAIPRPVRPGAELVVLLVFALEPLDDRPAARVLVRAAVRRVEPQPGGYGVALAFTQHRFLYAPAGPVPGDCRDGHGGVPDGDGSHIPAGEPAAWILRPAWSDLDFD